MLEKFEKKLNEFKNKKENELVTLSLDTVQDYFKMQDVNKWLKFNAMNDNQIRQADSYEQHLQNLLKKPYVPDYQSTNV